MTTTESRADHMITLKIPAGHLQVIFAGLGELPHKVSGPTHAYLSNQLAALAAEEQKIREDKLTTLAAEERKIREEQQAPVKSKNSKR